MALDTLRVAKRLREAGFTDPQAEAVVASMQEAAEGAAFATKADLDSVRGELKAEIAALRSELRETELRLEAKIRETELRLEAKIEASKAHILNRVFGLILGALIINIIAMIGAVFAVAKLLVH
jgi:molecular chaperone GrpE (heat shock protein)